MDIRPLCRVFSFGLMLLLSSPVRAEIWDEVAPIMRAGDYEGAVALLQPAAAQQPDEYQIHRVLGMCWMEIGNLTEAETHLRTAIRLQPDTSAARFSLAQVLALRGSIDEAADLLREVIALAPESSYAARAQHILPGLAQLKETMLVRSTPKRWDLYVRVAGEHDDNIPARSRHEPGDDTDAYRVVTSLRLAYRFPDQRLDAPWPTMEAGYSYYRSDYDDRAFRDYDVESHHATLEVARYGSVFGHWVKLGVTGSYGQTELGGEAFSDQAGVDTALSIQLAPALLTILGYSVSWKEFENDTDFPAYFSRDGNDQEVRIDTYTYLFDNRLILGLGYAYLWNDVDGLQFALNRHSVRASATLALPAKFRMDSSLTYATEDYDQFVPDPQREDDRILVYASLSRALWSEAWRGEASATYSTSDSSQDFAEYDRTVYGLAISWSP